MRSNVNYFLRAEEIRVPGSRPAGLLRRIFFVEDTEAELSLKGIYFTVIYVRNHRLLKQ